VGPDPFFERIEVFPAEESPQSESEADIEHAFRAQSED
jgi:hypothetical protein